MLRLEAFGPISLSGPGSPDLSQQRRRLALLTALASSGERGMTRDRILALLWSERPTEAGRRALDQMLYALRRSLGAELVLGVDPLRLNPHAIGSDLADFERAMAEGNHEAVVALYRGPLLDGFYVHDAPEFERWMEEERTHYAAHHRAALESLARRAAAAHDWGAAVRWWRQLATVEPLSSRVALELMRALAAHGDRVAALSHARDHESVVRRELDSEPDSAIAAYVVRLRADGASMRAALAPGHDRTGAVADGVTDARPAAGPAAPAMEPAHARDVRGPPTRQAALGWRYAIAVVLLVSGGVVAVRAAGLGPAASLIPERGLSRQRPVLVTDFRVSGIDTMTGAAAAVAIRTALTESPAVRPYPADSLADALVRMRQPAGRPLDLSLARDVAKREGIQAIVDGHVIGIGEGYDVRLRLVSAESGEELFSAHRFVIGPEGILPALDELSRALRGRIGESLRSVRASTPLPQMTTTSLEALRLYAAGVAAGHSERAVNLLRQAVSADSEFAMAYRRLGVVTGALRMGDADSALWKAYRYRAHLPERERLAVIALYYSLPGYGGDRPKAIVAYERLLTLGDTSFAVNLASVYRFRREYARAESLSVVAARHCGCPDPWDDLLYIQVDMGKLDAAERTLRAARSRFPSSALFREKWPAYMLHHRGDIDAYERRVDSLRALPDPTMRRTWTRIRRALALTRGRLREAERLRAEIDVLDGLPAARPGDRLQLVRVELALRGDTARARRLLEEEPTAASTWRGDQRALLDVAPLLARAGQPDRARHYLSRFDRLADTATRRKSIHDHHVAQGFIALAERRHADAIEEFRLGDLLPDGPRNPMWYQLSGRLGRVHDAAGQVDSAIAHYEQWATAHGGFRPETSELELAGTLERLGQLHARAGNRAKAAEHYARFIALWRDADEELQPRVVAARNALVALRVAPVANVGR